MKSTKLIYEYFKKYWPRYFLGIILVVVSTYLTTIIPKLLGMAIDGLNMDKIDVGYVRKIALFMGLAALFSFISRFIWRYLILGFCRKIEFYLREKLFVHLQELSSDYYVKNNTGDIITRAIVDIQAIRMTLGFGTVAIIDISITTIMSIVNMSLSTNIYLTLVALSPIPILAIIIIKVRSMIRSRYLDVQDAISDISSKVQENITGIRVIKAFSQETPESEAFSQLSMNKVNAELKLAKTFALINPAVQVVFGTVFSLFLIIGGSMVANGSISLGDYVSFNTYLMLIMGPVSRIGRLVDRWQRGFASMNRLDDIFLSKPTIDDTNADKFIKELDTGKLEAINLTFSYDKKTNVIDDINFSIPAGGSMAIMGPTGVGKSTITELLTRVWRCGDGMLFVDGKDINSIPLKVLRNNCAYVPQDSFLFSDTIMENIRFYDSTITDSKVYEAAKDANVHEDIVEFSKGFETVVGERGMTLSGGQKQRVTLARALVRQPKLLLLDDCMSALDSETEKRIIDNLKTKIKGCTTVIVTHRLSAAALCDYILFLGGDGAPAEFGTHEELMNLNGSYASMVATSKEDNDNGRNEGEYFE